MRRLLLAGTCLVVMSIISLVWATPSSAVGSCGTKTNNQVGWSTKSTQATQPHTYEGVSGNILTHINPALCTNPSVTGANFSTVWTMVFGPSGYVQSGTKFYPGQTCTREWAEQTLNGVQNDYYSYCVANSSYYKFWQQTLFTSGDWVLRSNVGGRIIHQAGFSIIDITRGGDGVAHVSFRGETYYAATNLPGSSSNPTDIQAMQVQFYSDDTFNDTCGNVILGRTNEGNYSRYAEGATSCNDIQVWTRT